MSEPGPRSIRAWALVLLVAAAVLGFQPFYLRALRIDRVVSTKQYDDLPYRRLPGLQQICEDVRRFVPRGETVAFGTPYPGWWDGYSFAYMRASYLLAEFRLVPLIDADDRAHPEVLEHVDWLLVLGDAPGVDGFQRVAEAGDMSLLRRAR